MAYNEARLRPLNRADVDPGGRYVLYWIQAYRRLDHNHALDFALARARELGRPLVIYEGLRLDYPWASERLHRFVLEGMKANAAAAARRGLNYWPFVETPKRRGRGLVAKLAARASLVVTDDFPCFIVPGQSEALARRAEVAVVAVDGSSVVPLSLLGAPVSAAAHLRPRIHKALGEAWAHRPRARPRISSAARRRVTPPFEPWRADDLDRFLAHLPLDRTVPPVAATPGGTPAARIRLKQFLERRLEGYAEVRSQPAPPEEGHASGLSPYLHFGHISIEEVAEAVLETTGAWSPDELRIHNRGRREGFFGDDPDVNAFLDQALTWRDLGFQWHRARRADTGRLEAALPLWALETLRAHAGDQRPYLYTAAQWEAGATHDPLWNAAQRELVTTGTIHGYLRMLWGKKVLEWSRTPEEAYRTLVHLNNRYALDGRDPNSYAGILWCFGLFDRPWAPRRPVLGTVRYMSSGATARKFRLQSYLDYVASLPTIEETRRGAQRKLTDRSP